jgi:hypothetical protein
LASSFIAGGGYMVLEGRSAHDEVRDNIVRESITVSGDAEEFAGEQVDSPGGAQAQSDAILEHTLAATGGYLYAQIGSYFLPEGNYMLPFGTYMTPDGDTTTDVTLAATDDAGKPINVPDESLAAKNASDVPVRGWTSDKALAATDANGAPVSNTLRNTAKDSAFLRRLGVAVMGFKVADRSCDIRLFLIVMGMMNVCHLASHR